jgi:hypothetical protein
MKQYVRIMNEEMVQKKASLLTFICVTSEFSLNFNIGPIKPKLETIKVKIKKNTPSSAIIVFN